MKFLILILSIIISGSSTCNKTPSNNSIKGKIVYRSCASTVIQVLDASNYKIAQDSWQQSPNTEVFKNVFVASNPCALSSLAVGSEFNFIMVPEERNDCMVCAMFDNPPTIKHLIKPVK